MQAPDLISALKILRDEVWMQSSKVNNALTKLLLYFMNQQESWGENQDVKKKL
jgi:hypothetical protein